MQERIGVWTPACPAPNELLDLAETGDAHPNALLLRMHVEGCAFCREQLDMLCATLALTHEESAAVPAPATPSSAGPQTAPTSLWTLLLSRIRGAQARPSVSLALAGVPILLLLVVTSLLWSRMHAIERDRHRLKGETEALRRQTETDRKIADNREAMLRGENAQLRTELKSEQSRPGIRILDFKDGEALLARDNHGRLSRMQRLPAIAVNSLDRGKLEIQKDLLAKLGRGKDLQLMGGNSDTFRLLAPVGTAIEAPNVVFRWEAVPGATSYILTIPLSNSEIQSPPILAQKGERVVTWTLSDPAHRLRRGVIYEWYVKAAQSTLLPPSIESPAKGEHARFRILSASESNDLAKDRQRMAGSHLALAAYYAKFGLLDDAEQELQILQSANPKNTQVRSLLFALQGQRSESR